MKFLKTFGDHIFAKQWEIEDGLEKRNKTMQRRYGRSLMTERLITNQ